MFSVCYVRRRTNDDDEKLKNVESHSIAVILVGRSTTANSPIFFHPHTKKIITTDDYVVDESLPAGPTFVIAYSGGLHFNSYAEQNAYLRPPTFRPSHSVWVNIRETYHKASIITLPSRENNIYTVRIDHDSSLHQFLEKDILDYDPYLPLDNDPSKNKLFPKWLKHDSPITYKIDGKYSHGKLLISNNHFFSTGPF